MTIVTMPRMRNPLTNLLAIAIITAGTLPAAAQQTPRPGQPQPPPGKPADTEVWEPVSKIVTPGATDAAPPSDAIVLFNGTDLDQWQSVRDKGPAGWTVADGVLTVNKQAGNIETKRSFRNYQLHIEWRIPAAVTGEGQARGNSGVFLA